MDNLDEMLFTKEARKRVFPKEKASFNTKLNREPFGLRNRGLEVRILPGVLHFYPTERDSKRVLAPANTKTISEN